MKKLSKYSFIDWIAYLLLVLCFPLNPLVFLNVIEPNPNLIKVLFYLGWIIWVFGMALVMAPIIIFPRWGRVAKGKSFVHTTHLVDTGIYAVVRHPQYFGVVMLLLGLGLLLSLTFLFFASLFLFLWFRSVLIPFEEKELVAIFGDQYKNYMRQVPSIIPFKIH